MMLIFLDLFHNFAILTYRDNCADFPFYCAMILSFLCLFKQYVSYNLIPTLLKRISPYVHCQLLFRDESFAAFWTHMLPTVIALKPDLQMSV